MLGEASPEGDGLGGSRKRERLVAEDATTDDRAAKRRESLPGSSASDATRSDADADGQGVMISVTSGDGQRFTVDRTMFCAASTFVRNAAQDTDLRDLTMPDWLTSTSLRFALQHTRWHASSTEGKEAASTWDAAFVRKLRAHDAPELLKLLRSASYLEMEALLAMLCREVCAGLRRHSRSQIRGLFPLLSSPAAAAPDGLDQDEASADADADGPQAIARVPGCQDALEAHLGTVSETETMRQLHLPATAVPALAALQVARALRAADWQGMAKLSVLKRLPNRRSTTATYEVVHKQTDERAVLKQVRLDTEGVPVVVLREVALLKTLQHPNLVQLKGAWHGADEAIAPDADAATDADGAAAAAAAGGAAGGGAAADGGAEGGGAEGGGAGGGAGGGGTQGLNARISLVYEHVDANLRVYIRKLVPLTLPLAAVQAVAFQAVRGLAWCHANGVLHRDVTPHNLRYCPATGTVKVTGFELAREIGSVGKRGAPLTHEVVTLWYRSPEVLLGSEHYGPPLDAWSMGAVLAELATGVPLLPGDSEIGQLMKTFKLLGTPTEESWPGVTALPNFNANFPIWSESTLEARVPQLAGGDGLELVQALLTPDPEHRLSLQEALHHPFFDDVDKVSVGTRPLPGMPAL